MVIDYVVFFKINNNKSVVRFGISNLLIVYDVFLFIFMLILLVRLIVCNSVLFFFNFFFVIKRL